MYLNNFLNNSLGNHHTCVFVYENDIKLSHGLLILTIMLFPNVTTATIMIIAEMTTLVRQETLISDAHLG